MLNLAISESMASLYGRVYGHDRTTATTYINDNVVVCILEDILSTAEGSEVAAGDGVGGHRQARRVPGGHAG